MNAPLMISVAGRLVERGHRVVRFNFRGTGKSGGQHEGGESEIHDVEAAIAIADALGLPVAIAGWSFGAAIALRWLAAHDSTIPYVGIAPAPRIPPR